MRLIILFVFAGVLGCTARTPLNVVAAGRGETCTISVNGRLVASEAELHDLVQSNRKAVLKRTSETPFKCVSRTMDRLYAAGVKVLTVDKDSASILLGPDRIGSDQKP